MGLIINTLPKEDMEVLLGMQLLEQGIPSSWLEQVDICPYGVEGHCESMKDAEYVQRCWDFNFLDCKLYQDFFNNPDLLQKPESEIETIAMQGDDIVNFRDSYDDSLHDQVADGVDVINFRDLRSSLRTPPEDYRVDTIDLD